MRIPDSIPEQVSQALREDIGSGDVTADLIPAQANATATILTRVDAVMAGRPWVEEVFKQVDSQVSITWHAEDGDHVAANSVLCTLNGNSRSLLTGERSALNFLQLLSATATQTAQYVKAVASTNTKILDTRKTIPGLRLAQKYAVLCGGGQNHRIGLYDMILIKENHIMAAGSISQAIAQARALHPTIKIEVETENLEEFKEAAQAKADIIMLDEFSHEDMRKAVSLNTGNIPLEASGGITLETIRGIAETGIDLISIGGITKHVHAVDLSMRFK